VEYEQAMREREQRQRKAEEVRIAQQPAEAAAAPAQQVHDFRARCGAAIWMGRSGNQDKNPVSRH
jgi:hypothetical protein